MHRGEARAALFGIALFTLTTFARAQEPERDVRASFTWRAPPGCVNDQALTRSVEALVKRKVFVPSSEADVLVEGAAEPRAEGGWTATLRMRAQDGRELGVRSIVSEGSDCRAIEGPLAVVLALLVDLERREIVLEVPPPASEPPKRAEKPKPPLKVEPERAPAPEPERWHGTTSFGAVGAWGLLPALAFGIAARGQVEVVPGVVPGLELSAWPEKQSDDAGPGGGFSAWLVTALGCVEKPQLYGCVGISSGIVSAAGIGLARAESPSRWYVGANARIGAKLSLFGPLRLGAELGVGASFTRPRFYYEEANGNQVDVHRSAVLVPLGGIFLRADL
jgi:hypothetical protein